MRSGSHPHRAVRLLWNDVGYDIDRNYPVVADIVAPAGNHPPGYPDYTIYCISFDQLASLTPPKGYAA